MDSDRIKTVALSAAISVLVSVCTVYLYDSWYAPKMAVFDLGSYLETQKNNYISGRINEEKLKEEFTALKERLDVFGEKKIVLSKAAVLSGGEDITDELTKSSEK